MSYITKKILHWNKNGGPHSGTDVCLQFRFDVWVPTTAYLPQGMLEAVEQQERKEGIAILI